MAFTPASTLEAVEALYIGYFGRAGEPGGVQYWIGQINGGQTFAQAAAAFSVQAEAKDTHPFLANPDLVSPEAFITSLYNNLLERAPDAPGLAYWVGQATAAAGNPFAIGLLVAQFISGATNSDAGNDIDTLQNKIDAAEYFTTSLAAAGIQGVDADGQVTPEVDTAATSIIGNVTSDDATVEAAKVATDDFVNDGGQGPGTPGLSFELTNAVEVFRPNAASAAFRTTANNDSFFGTAGEFQDGDVIDAGLGTDLLDTGIAAAVATAQLISVENVIFRASAAASFNAATSTGIQRITSTSTDTLALTGVNLSTVVGVNGGSANNDVTVTFATTAGDDTATISFDDAAIGATITVLGGPETLNVKFTGSGGGDFTSANTETVNFNLQGDTADLHITITDAESLIVTGTGDLDLHGSASDLASLVTFDSSALNGDVFGANEVGTGALFFNNSVDLETVTTGAGDDKIQMTTAGATAEAITVDLGAGNDEFYLAGASNVADTTLSVTLGAGEDLFTVSALANVTDQADFEADMITWEDFDLGDDVLDISGLGVYNVIDNVERAAIAAATTLEAAVDIAINTLAAGQATVFDYGGNAYVIDNALGAGGGLANGDGIMMLVGVSVADFSATNFITG